MDLGFRVFGVWGLRVKEVPTFEASMFEFKGFTILFWGLLIITIRYNIPLNPILIIKAPILLSGYQG